MAQLKITHPNYVTHTYLRSFYLSIEALELGVQMSTHEVEDFSLKVKSTGELRKFNLLSEEKFMKNLDNNARRVSQFDMNKLEIEYDYDTESEQIAHSK